MTTADHRPVPAPLAHTDVLVLDYLAALWAAAEELTPDTRDELMGVVADYIALRRTGPGDDPEYVLRLLGPPESLVAAARRGRMPVHLTGPLRPPPPAPRPPAPRGESRASEYTAIALLTGGAVLLPVVGPLSGLLVAMGSPRWTGAQKAVAAVVAVGTALVGGVFGLLVVAAGADLGLFFMYLAVVVGPIAAALTLLPGLSDNRRPPAPPGWR
ncbi:hypothetical protein [Spirilliplanes yamanashiensis]|uniref:Uncharacterized protein n=1 Tax=Spirilliplanes yamanashiensis TaxID=42233 RepID=A0A8J3YCY9_9ACTN|nr:hypothetical protein [Spirilliplanes yamanashiensis]MDP9818983.1 hypothetical protein [Spirilliplanes yamanashiensis]GIJ05438.1 hypothetical protein Sya03_47900 [Spirilliplanes yamanashiensis]